MSWRLVELGLPADRDEPRDALELTVEALDHAFKAAPLETRVARRGHEHANLPRAFRHVCLSLGRADPLEGERIAHFK